jgi:DNA-directed RNA polymerase beta subunit
MDEQQEQQPTATDTAPDKSGADAASTFTQEQVNAIVGERARRAEESAVSNLLKSLGFEKADELKAMIEDTRKRQAAEMSEAERAKAEAEKVRKEADSYKTALEAERQARISDKRDSAITSALKTADNPQAILTLLKAEAADEVAKVLTEDGKVDEKALGKLVKEAEAKWPGLFKPSAPGTPSHSDGKTPQAQDLFKGLPKLRL